MTDDSEVGRLPQFARDVAVLARGVPPGREAGRDDSGVLTPFSGVLDVHVRSGQVPTLDLSYLTLGSLVVPGVARSRGAARASPATDSAPARRTGTRGDATSDEGREPTVREALSGHDDAGEDDAASRSSAVLDDAPRTRFDLGTERRDVSGAPDRSRISDPPSDASARATVARSGADESPGDSFEDVDPTTRTRTGRTEDGPETTSLPRGRSTGAADRTPAMLSGRPIPSLGEVAPPRLLTRRTEPPDSGRRASGTDAGTTGIAPPRMTPERPAASADTGQSSSGPSDRGDRDGSRRSAPGDANATDARPRMVVDSGLGSADRAGDPAATSVERLPSVDGTDVEWRESNGRADTPEERIAAVVEASTDPESRLVDRLYRSLQEREAIERRRRGGR